MNKFALTILSLLLVLILGAGGYLAYQKYFAGNSTVPAQQVNQTAPTPKNNPAGAIKLSQNQVVGPALSYSGQSLTFFTTTGQIYQATVSNTNGNLQLQNEHDLNVMPKTGISKILWPLAGPDFIAQLGTTTPTWSYFHSSNSSYVDLPSQIESLDWLPSGDKILYIWVENGKATLNSSSPDSTNWQKVADMWETDDELHISPDGLTVAYFETKNTKDINSIYSTTPDGKVWKTLVSSGYNSGVLWSPDSKKFLFGKKDPVTGKFELWEYDVLAGQAKDLQLVSTPDKAVWGKDSKFVYAASPAVFVNGNLTNDNLVRIDVNTLAQKPYSTTGQVIDAENLFLSSDGKDLLFKNLQDGYLYYIDVSQ